MHTLLVLASMHIIYIYILRHILCIISSCRYLFFFYPRARISCIYEIVVSHPLAHKKHGMSRPVPSSRRRPRPQDAGEFEATAAAPSPRDVPVSLGKPSLRLRLEAYYSLISPDVIADGAAWRKRFGQIYDKYGGTAGGERALATKLAKKYGGRVRLLLTTAAAGQRQGGGGGRLRRRRRQCREGGQAGRGVVRSDAFGAEQRRAVLHVGRLRSGGSPGGGGARRRSSQSPYRGGPPPRRHVKVPALPPLRGSAAHGAPPVDGCGQRPRVRPDQTRRRRLG